MQREQLVDCVGAIQRHLGTTEAQRVRADQDSNRSTVPGNRHFFAALDPRQQIRQRGARLGRAHHDHDHNCTTTH